MTGNENVDQLTEDNWTAGSNWTQLNQNDVAANICSEVEHHICDDHDDNDDHDEGAIMKIITNKGSLAAWIS